MTLTFTIGAARRIAVLGALALSALTLVLLARQAGGEARTLPVSVETRYPIKHIVIIDKENHSFDNMFGRFPGADGAQTARTSSGQTVDLIRTPDHTLLDIAHAGDAAAYAVDAGRMD